ncbi:MAG: DUF3536 domain-containing protein [Acidobacteriota bacterium]
MTLLVLHGHFYQPPREDPWTDDVPPERGAAPFHDWNERIDAECYRANAFARQVDNGPVFNNFARLSFDLGPTLARWIERHDPEVLARLREADRASSARFGGHGNAMAQSYSHAILPLCDPLDRATEIRWGLADFRHRFGRNPEGMWLPETAADEATLCDLIDHGLSFAVLSPRQAARVRAPGEDWQGVSPETLDVARPYRFTHRDGSGRAIAIFFYDGAAAQAVAFGGTASDSGALLDRLIQAALGKPFVTVAVDGETFGHHQPHGDRALARALFGEAQARGLRPTNFGELLERFPPRWDVEIDLGPLGEGSSWSCFHGVGRWARDCGCRFDPDTVQTWRGPLRAALDFLRDRSREFYLAASAPLLRDPWAARDAYVQVLLDPGIATEARFLGEHATLPGLRESERVLTLLEMQRQALLMYASCGWFFDDISGLEAGLVLRRAARLIDLFRALGGSPPESRFVDLLAAAPSNFAAAGNGADIYRARRQSGAASHALTASDRSAVGAVAAGME